MKLYFLSSCVLVVVILIFFKISFKGAAISVQIKHPLKIANRRHVQQTETSNRRASRGKVTGDIEGMDRNQSPESWQGVIYHEEIRKVITP